MLWILGLAILLFHRLPFPTAVSIKRAMSASGPRAQLVEAVTELVAYSSRCVAVRMMPHSVWDETVFSSQVGAGSLLDQRI